MNASRAFASLGAMRRRELTLMVAALSFHSHLNNFQERERLAAGKWAMEHWSQYMRETYLRLNRKGM